jgi:hypothetical protein
MNSRTGFCKVILVITFGLFLISCGVAMTKGQNWLDSKKDNPEINISGAWTSSEWGAASFKQENRNVEGVLGDYPVKGVVSGNSIYLLMYSGNKVDYSAELKALDNNTFEGFYSKYAIVDEAESKRKVSLQRIN